jgi:hypothetical protein
VAVAPRALAEAPSERFGLPPQWVGIARRYLVALHSADAAAPAEPATPGPIQDNTAQEQTDR